MNPIIKSHIIPIAEEINDKLKHPFGDVPVNNDIVYIESYVETLLLQAEKEFGVPQPNLGGLSYFEVYKKLLQYKHDITK
jgi:hypothetical protein